MIAMLSQTVPAKLAVRRAFSLGQEHTNLSH
jgi:hypothetical protein